MALYKDKNTVSDSHGIGVIKRHGESFEGMCRRFKRIISKTGIIKELNQRKFFEKKCEKKKRKNAESIKRMEKRERTPNERNSSRRQNSSTTEV